MHCGRASNLLSAYIDRELAGTEMLQLRRHLDGCPACFSQHEALRRMKSLLSIAPPGTPSGDPTAALMQRWAERREPPVRARAARSWKWPWIQDSRRWQRSSLALTSACLVLALAGTALALRKPNYPDALAAHVLPSLQWEEKLPPLKPSEPRQDRWISDQRREMSHRGYDPWWTPPARVVPLLVSDTYGPSSGWGR